MKKVTLFSVLVAVLLVVFFSLSHARSRMPLAPAHATSNSPMTLHLDRHRHVVNALLSGSEED